MGILKLPQSVKLYLKAVELEVGEVSERSERASFEEDEILAMNPANWLQT